jgi:dipeptidase
MRTSTLTACCFAALAPTAALACSSILVSKGATADAAPMTTYVADSHELFGDLKVTPAAFFPEGATCEIIEWDTGKKLGTIPQVRRTFAVVGNLNEKQVAIGESTFTGREELRDPTAVIDYGSLMQLALQRAATAREAVTVMTTLVAQHGYASTGESFSISDPNEAWLLEMIGKGPGNKGAVWVARRVPDGYLTAHANVSRIHTFPLNDKDTLYSKDVITFARARGWFTGKDADFSFSDAYAPLTWEDLRFCEARVWSVFRRAAPSLKLAFDPERGAATRMPLWVKPDRKLAVADVMALMRDHFEGTPFDLTQGLGAGPYGSPYRWRPLTWQANGHHYLNDRSISTQQTGFSFISQSRAGLPDAIGGLLWFGVDDTATTVWVPLYASLSAPPPSFAPGRADLLHYSPDSAFWVFNQVANHVYARYSEEVVDLQVVQRELEGGFLARQAAVEQAALEKYRRSPEEARSYLSAYSTQQAEHTVKRWRELGEALLVKYLDGNFKDELGKVKHPGYPAAWNELVAQSDGKRLEVKHLPTEPRTGTPVKVTGYFHSRDELGALAAQVPKDFDFTREKLLLMPGSDACQRPPRCCVTPKSDGDRLLVEPPKDEAKDPCGTPAWLVRLAQQEQRPLVQPAAE